MEFVILSSLAFLFWMSQKLTDWHHEHGLSFFPWAKIFFWVLAWIITFYLISYNEVLFITYFSLLLYWLILLKVDNHGHMITAIFMIFGVLYFWNHNTFPILEVFLMFLSYCFLNFVRKKLKIKILHKFFKYRIHFFIPPIILAIYLWNIYALSMVFFNISWTYFANYIFKIK